MSLSNPNRTLTGSLALERALEAVERLGRSGYALVPVDPSPAMIRTGSRIGRISLEEAEMIYRAMVAAAE